MLRRSLTGVALALAVTVGAIALNQDASIELPNQPTPAVDRTPLQAGLAESIVEREPVTGPVATPLQSAISEEPREPIERTPLGQGVIEGMVLDEAFQPLGHKRLLFRRADPALSGGHGVPSFHSVYSDRDGRYSVQVTAGEWDVLYEPLAGEVQRPSPWPMGRVRVENESSTLFDVHVHALRTIRGGAVVREHENVLLDILLFRDAEPLELVTRTETWNDLEMEQLWQSGETDEGEEGEARVRPGSFIFGGLEPATYILRLHLSPNDDLYIDERVDVRVSNADLGFRELKYQDFYDAMDDRRNDTEAKPGDSK